MVTEKIYVNNVWQSLVVSLVFASIIILLATHNIILTVYAVTAIGCIVTSVLGLINLLGWRIGIAESIATDFFVGFSVDYVVHVAHQYSHSRQTSRVLRVKSIYQNIGVAVFSGAATTFIAVTFFLFSGVYVLLKFGVLMQLTLAFAILYALVVLPALLCLAGPESRCGDVKYHLYDRLA